MRAPPDFDISSIIHSIRYQVVYALEAYEPKAIDVILEVFVERALSAVIAGLRSAENINLLDEIR